jgi:hypothetical protein
MTAKDLIDALSRLPPELPVHLADESGDFRIPVSAARVKETIADGNAACLVRASEV